MILGIDIRTTASAAVHIPGASPRSIFTADNRRGFSSCVIFDSQGNLLKAGTAALEECNEHSGFSLSHFKRIMGYTYDEIQEGLRLGKRFFEEYRDCLERGTGNRPLIRVGGKTYHVEEIMAIFLDEIHRTAEGVMGEPIDQAVIAVPI